MRPLCLAAAALVLAAAAPSPPAGAPDPAWVANAVGHFAGLVRNAGRLECHRTEFSLAEGHLVGRYAIDDPDPFGGTLTDFAPADDHSGTFQWHDRYGVGVEFVAFNDDYSSFTGDWGAATPLPTNPVMGRRGANGCDPAVSLRSGETARRPG